MEELPLVGPGGSTRPHGEVKAGWLQRKRQDLGHMPLLASICAALGGSQGRVGLVDSNRQDERFGKLHRGLP